VAAEVADFFADAHCCFRTVRDFVEPATRLVRQTWKLPWPWLVMDLWQMFTSVVGGILANQELPIGTFEPLIPHMVDPQRARPPVRRVENFNEGVRESIDWIRRHPQPRPGSIGRDVDWLYRAHIKEPRDTIGALA